MSSTTPVKQFFSAFGKGDVDGVVSTFTPDATITAVRAGARPHGELHGTYVGTAGVHEFLAAMGTTLDTKDFTVDVIAGDGDVAFAKGAFTHIVKRTGRSFQSDWALMCRVRDGRIAEFRFFEDSAAFVAASAP